MENDDSESRSKSLPRSFQRRVTWPRLIATLGDVIFWEDGDVEEIGCGFFSNVYKFYHNRSGHTVAVKVAKDVSEHDDHEREVMMREIQLLKKLSHPNIIKYFGLCAKEGSFHPVLELVNGGSLEQLLTDQSILLSWSDKIGFCRDISEGMTYLHSCNIFHRDLKSGNCLIRVNEYGDRTVIVSDFGLAREVAGNTEKPRKLSVVGSPYFMAPEILNSELYNSKVDVFSFGILACEILARVGNNPDDLPRLRNFGLDFNEFQNLCPTCPGRLLNLVKECTEVNDPFCRPAFEEIVTALDETKLDLNIEQYDVTIDNVTHHRSAEAEQRNSDKTLQNRNISNRNSNTSVADCDAISNRDSNETIGRRKRVNFCFDSITVPTQRQRFANESSPDDLAPSSGSKFQRSTSLPNLIKKESMEEAGSPCIENQNFTFCIDDGP